MPSSCPTRCGLSASRWWAAGAQLDLDKPAFDRTVQAFGAALAGADVGLFYYAGHGVQVRGENYLIPVDANPTKEADVDFQMLDTNLVLRQMEGAGTRLNIVILDACRNNPFGGRSLAVGRARDAENDRMRDTAGGLAQMQAPEGTLISFATQPGSVAQDGADGNSPYARALADTIRKPGLGIFDAFNQIGLQVKRATKGVQQPWVSSSPIDGAFYFVPPGGAVSAPVAAGPAADEIAWGYLKSTTDVRALRQFADEFPQGSHRSEAQARIAALEQEAARADAERQRMAALTPPATAAPALAVPVGPLAPERERALKPKDSFKECDGCPVMVTMPAGSFTMGSPASEPQRGPDEGPQQQIAIRQAFAVGRSEVSFDEWFACVAEGGCNAYRPGDYGWGAGKRPVINVSWTDAQAYVKWLSQKDRRSVSAVVGVGTRICGARLHVPIVPLDPVLVRQGHLAGARELRLALFLRRQRQGAAAPAHGRDRRLRTQPVRPPACAWQRVGVGAGLLERQPRRPAQ